MTYKASAHAARQTARSLLRSGWAEDPLVQKRGRVTGAIIVRTRRGEVHSWFVPVVLDHTLAGYFQLLPDLVPMRYASFQRRKGSLEGCPPVSGWTDAQLISRRAVEYLPGSRAAGAPMLSFDENPDRLAWLVSVIDREGMPHEVFVTGDFAYERSAPSGGGESIP